MTIEKKENDETVKIIMIISLWLVSFIFWLTIINIYNQECWIWEYKIFKIIKVNKKYSYWIDKNDKKYKINKKLTVWQIYRTVLCKNWKEKIFTANQKNENILNNYKYYKLNNNKNEK